MGKRTLRISIACLSVLLALALSGCDALKALGLSAPDAVTGLAVADATASTLEVSWGASTGATSYRLYRSTDAAADFTSSDPVYDGGGTACTDADLTAGTAYYYVVVAVNEAGDSALCAAASGTTTVLAAPAAPTIVLVGDATGSSLSIAWQSVADAESYQLFRAASSSGPWTTKVYDGSLTGCSDTGLTAGTTYYYKVQATNSVGSSALSSAVSGKTSTALSTDAYLSSMTIDCTNGDTILYEPTFASTTYSYSAADVNTAEVTYSITLTLDDSSAAITSVTEYYSEDDGETYDQYSCADTGADGVYQLTLNNGYNQVRVLVTAADGSTRTYTVTTINNYNM